MLTIRISMSPVPSLLGVVGIMVPVHEPIGTQIQVCVDDTGVIGEGVVVNVVAIVGSVFDGNDGYGRKGWICWICWIGWIG